RLPTSTQFVLVEVGAVAVPYGTPVTAHVTREERHRVLRGFREDGDGAGGDGDRAEPKPRPFQVAAQGEDAAAPLLKLLVRASGAESGDERCTRERVGDLACERHPTRATNSINSRHAVAPAPCLAPFR